MKLEMIKAPVVIAVDVNGTTITSSIFQYGKFERISKNPTPIYSMDNNFDDYLVNFMTLLKTSIQLCHDAIKSEERDDLSIKRFYDIPIGISFSGQVSNDGIIHSASSIFKGETPKNLNLIKLVKTWFPKNNVFILNNVSAAAWKFSEEEFSNNCNRFLVLHIGSGFGSKIFDNQKKEEIIDAEGLSGELGHIYIEKPEFLKPYRFLCDCNKENHLASFILPKGLVYLFKHFNKEYCASYPQCNIHNVDTANVFKLIEENYNTFGSHILEYVAEILSKVISIFVLSIGVDKLIIKGSQFYRFNDAIRESFILTLENKIKYFLQDYSSIPDSFIINKFSNEDDDRIVSLQGLFNYINNYFSSAYRVAKGFLLKLPGYCVTCRNDISYSVIRTKNLFNQSNNVLKEILQNRKALIIIDNYYNMGHDNKLHQLLNTIFAESQDITIKGIDPGNNEIGEKKDMKSVLKIIEYANEMKLPRDGVFIGIGGGVILDIVGFAAQQYRRMVDYIRVPTTLIGQVDAGIGVKVGVNYKENKNLLGAFYPPLISINHIPFLFDLPNRQIECGIAEIIKMGIIDSELIIDELNSIEEELTGSSLRNNDTLCAHFIYIMDEAIEKMLIHLQKNLFEKYELRRYVDFGHTFSPVVESLSNYRVPHGYAVAIDMFISCFIANKLDLIDSNILTTYKKMFAKFNIFVTHDILNRKEEIFKLSIKKTIQHRGGNLNLVVPLDKIGHAGFIDLKECENNHKDKYCSIVKESMLLEFFNEAVKDIIDNGVHFE